MTKVGVVGLNYWGPNLVRNFADLADLAWVCDLDPEHLAKWWGAKGFSNTFEKFEPKAGGNWRYVMHGPDKSDYKNESVFVEVTKPSRIVVDHVSAPKFRLTASFGDRAGISWLRDDSSLRTV